MHDSESVSLRRAALLLLAVSLARWGSAHLGSRDALRSEDLLPEHAAATERAAAQGDRRGTPLAPDERLDPNRADAAELDRLPGIGPATAAAIVEARDSGLAFRRTEDLLAVRGIGPALLNRIGPLLDLSSPPSAARRRPARRTVSDPRPDAADPSLPARAIDINRADADELQRLPGIGPALAARIVAERRVRPFASVDDLQRVQGIGAATVARLGSTVVVGSSR